MAEYLIFETKWTYFGPMVGDPNVDGSYYRILKKDLQLALFGEDHCRQIGNGLYYPHLTMPTETIPKFAKELTQRLVAAGFQREDTLSMLKSELTGRISPSDDSIGYLGNASKVEGSTLEAEIKRIIAEELR